MSFVLRITLASLLFLLACLSQAQPTVSISTWKNQADGAYTIVHDDVGDFAVQGVLTHADTMAFNRGIKLTFGIITSSCEGNFFLGQSCYALLKDLADDHGHELMNHSHTHSCAITNGWCEGGTNSGWAQTGTFKYDVEVDQSTQSIINGTGYTPRYFIYPYDQFNAASSAYIKSKGYIGERTGAYDADAPSNHAPDGQGFFKTPLVVDVSGNLAQNLNFWVDEAIANGSWVNRELHNVGSSGWGSVTVTNYRTHLNYVKSKMNSGELWVSTVSELLTYQIQKLNFVPSSAFDAGSGNITVSWNDPTFDVEAYLAPLQVKSPISLIVDLSSYPGDYVPYQNGVALEDWTINGNTMVINVYPHEGDVLLSYSGCPSVCIIEQPMDATIDANQNHTFTVNAVDVLGDIDYQWYFENAPIDNANNASLSLNNATVSNAGDYYVVVTSGSHTVTSNTVSLIVQTQNPFSSRIAIPGILELEDFDEGGQGVSYNETSAGNQGSATTYRTGPVDVEICTEGGHNIGYITDGEWLEYSVSVAANDNYNLVFRTAAANSANQGQIQLFLDGVEVMPATSIANTGGWQTWASTTIENIALSAGDHILRVAFPNGDLNINYISFTATGTSISNGYAHQKVFTYYPNPAQDWISIHNYSNETLVEILETNGRVVRTENMTEPIGQLNIADLPKGVYIVRIGLHSQQLVKL
jgi:hypothetical protein